MNVYSNIHTSLISPENIVKNGRQSEKKQELFSVLQEEAFLFKENCVFQHNNSNCSLLKINYFCCNAKNVSEWITLLFNEKTGC